MFYRRYKEWLWCISHDSVFSGSYITGDLDTSYFENLSNKRNDNVKEQARNL